MKRMKKLMGLLAVLVVILAATAAAKLLNPENKTEEEAPAQLVFAVNTADVTKLGWDYSEKILFERSEDGWIYGEDETFPVNTAYLDTMLDALTEITSSRTIEDVEDWDQYGLEVPVCTVTVTTDSTYTLSIGIETAMGGERYISIGDGNVYLVDAGILDAFSYGLYDVLQEEQIPSMTGVTGIRLESDAQSYEIICQENSGLTYSDSYVWFMDGKALDTELTENLIYTILDLYWEECVNFHAGDLAQYGLDDPEAVVTVNYTKSVSVSTGELDENGDTVFETRKDPVSFTLEIGSAVGEDCYARIQGSNMVYTIDGSVLDTLLYTSYYELQPDEVILMEWEELTSMDVILNGNTYTFIRDTKTATDEEGNESEETVYTLNGNEVEAETILEALDATGSVGYAYGMTPERGEEIRFVFYRENEAFPEVELAFYQYNSTACMTTLDGNATVFADREAVVALVEAVNALVLA